jgi:hypothetical protein
VTNVVLVDAAAETAGADRLLAELAVKPLGLAPGGAEAVPAASLADGAEQRRLAGIAAGSVQHDAIAPNPDRPLIYQRGRCSSDALISEQTWAGVSPAPIPLLFSCSPDEIPLLTGKIPLFHRVGNFGSNRRPGASEAWTSASLGYQARRSS